MFFDASTRNEWVFEASKLMRDGIFVAVYTVYFVIQASILHDFKFFDAYISLSR